MLKDVGCLQAEFRFSPMKKANLVGFVALLVISTEMVKPEVTRARTWSDLFQAPSRSVVRGKLSTLSCGESGTPSSATVWLGGRGRVGRLLSHEGLVEAGRVVITRFITIVTRVVGVQWEVSGVRRVVLCPCPGSLGPQS